MLRSPTVWQRFSRIVVVHGAREVAHLGYADELRRLAQARPEQFAYMPMVTREAAPEGVLFGRLPALLGSGELERRIGLELGPNDSHVLLCGNPGMIDEVQRVLAERGLNKHRPRKPGHISIESYW